MEGKRVLKSKPCAMLKVQDSDALLAAVSVVVCSPILEGALRSMKRTKEERRSDALLRSDDWPNRFLEL